MPDSDTLDLARKAAQAALAKKAFDIVIMDVSELTSFTDAFVICSTSSERHLDAVTDAVRSGLKTERKPHHIEGTPAGQWILMDFGDVIVHLFTEERRVYYNLEGLWSDARKIEVDDSTPA
jgi:ribosome-associated protein